MKTQNTDPLILARDALKSIKPDLFEIFTQKSQRLQIDAKDGKVDSLTRSEDVGLSVRVIHKNRMGFSYTTSLTPQAIERTAHTAFEIAKNMPEDRDLQFFDFSKAKYAGELRTVDHDGLKTSTDKKTALALALEEKCRAFDKRITGVRSASVKEILGESRMMDTNGNVIAQSATLYTATLTCKAEQDGESQMGGDFDFSHTLGKLNTELVSKRGAESALELLGGKVPQTMKCPAVLRNDVVAELLEFMASSFQAEELDKGRSLLIGKQGQKVFSPKMLLIDDGLMSGGYATSSFDGEGVPSQKNILVQDGAFLTPLYDLKTAKKHGTKPSGTAGRSIQSAPSSGLTNFFLKPGTKSYNELIGSISSGVLITGLMGVHTANPVTGDFSLGATGIMIQNGKLTHALRGFAVAGNILDLFKSLGEIGSDLRFFGGVGAPSLLIDSLSVGGA